MNKYLKILAFSAITLSLSACLEVEDNNDNQELVDTLEAQNEILREQAESDVPATVTMFGKVENLGTRQAVGNATMTVKIGGSEWGEPINVSNGDFEITGLPGGSDFELLIQSADSAFMDRALFGTTPIASDGIVYRDMGVLGVSEAETVTFTIEDFNTTEPVPNLNFIGYSHIGSGSNYRAYAHASSFNEETGEYSLTIPVDISVSFSASLDTDSDGNADWSSSPHFSQSVLSFNTSELLNSKVFFVYPEEPGEEEEPRELEVRLSILDDNLDTLSGDLTVTTADALNGTMEATYDEETRQYVLNALMQDSLEVFVPAFSIGEIHYGSASVRISVISSQSSLRVNISGSANNTYYDIPSTLEVLDIAVRPAIQTPYTNLELVTNTGEILAPSYVFKAFFSNAIELTEGSLQLLERGTISITEGNAYDDDLVLPGTTLIVRQDQEIDVSTGLALNNTLLTATPSGTLKSATDYRYRLESVVDGLTGVESNIARQVDFKTDPEPSVFDINDLSLDNDNYTTGGAPIQPSNTAEAVSNPYDYNRTVYLILPRSIENLNSFVISKQLVIEEGLASNPIRSFDIVEEGQPLVSKTYLFSAAQNENIENINNSSGYYNNFMYGTAHADGYWYTLPVSEYMSDHTGASENTITFNYVYEAADGTVSNGQITMEVQ